MEALEEGGGRLQIQNEKILALRSNSSLTGGLVKTIIISMGIFEAIVLGIVQGLSEFLPISSSGHLVVFQKILTPGPHSILFDLAVHLGTVLSILTLYRKSIQKIFSQAFKSLGTKSSSHGLQLVLFVFVANIPTAIIGFGFKDQFEQLFSNFTAVGVCFFLTGLLLFVTRWKSKSGQMKATQLDDLSGLESMTYGKAIVIGIAQGLAIAPGISRSGSTIAAGILIGVEKSTAALFSFVMSIPAILGASLIELKDFSAQDEISLMPVISGFVAAYLSGLIGLGIVLKFVKKGRLEVFSYYLWALSLFILYKQLV